MEIEQKFGPAIRPTYLTEPILRYQLKEQIVEYFIYYDISKGKGHCPYFLPHASKYAGLSLGHITYNSGIPHTELLELTLTYKRGVQIYSLSRFLF